MDPSKMRHDALPAPCDVCGRTIAVDEVDVLVHVKDGTTLYVHVVCAPQAPGSARTPPHST